MAFRTYIYEAADGTSSFKLRMDMDQAALAGAVIAGATTQGFHVKVSKTRRAYGLEPRHLVIKRVVGIIPDDRAYYSKVPICTEAAFAAVAQGDVVLINGINWTVDQKVAETKR